MKTLWIRRSSAKPWQAVVSTWQIPPLMWRESESGEYNIENYAKYLREQIGYKTEIRNTADGRPKP